MNSFLLEVSDPTYGSSRDQQKRIESVMNNLISFLVENEIKDDDEQLSLLNAPFGGNSDEILFLAQNKKLLKQKICRELRVVEACVDILHSPFASGSFKYLEIGPEYAILSLCKLSYTLLSQIAEQYPLNELYAS